MRFNASLAAFFLFLVENRLTMSDKKHPRKVGRREFIKTGSLAAGAFMIVPRHVLGGKGYIPPSDKLNIAGIGAGGKAWDNIPGAWENGAENIVALCDVDHQRAADMFRQFPKAVQYKDFREMLDRQKDIDAVMVSTPDHIHAFAALAAMQLGKHVYVEKPLTHSIFEARVLADAAKKYPVVTQMGNQGSSMDSMRDVSEWIQAGVIGEVRRVHCWTDRPVWTQGLATPKEKASIPKGLDWELWLGPAPFRNYHPSYMPFRWRGWWDFGTGALGDMGCHLIDIPYRALNLGYPIGVEASASQVFDGDFERSDRQDSAPTATVVHFYFPQRGDLPPVELIWYDGGIRPPRPKELAPTEPLSDDIGGCLFEGSNGKLLCGIFGSNPTLLPAKRMAEFVPPPQKIIRVKESHQRNWVKAIKEGTPTTAPFDFACKLTETILIGNLAVRCFNLPVLKPGKRQGQDDAYHFGGRIRLDWDASQMKVTNLDEANQFVRRTYRQGWSLG